MPRVSVFQGGNIQRAGTTGSRVRAADFSANPVAEGLKAAGRGLADVTERQDQLADVKARVEANQLDLEHLEAERLINRGVKETLGQGAEAAAETAAVDLGKRTKEILGRASPRARLLLEQSVLRRNAAAIDGYDTHGFSETVKAFDASSLARIKRQSEVLADEPDEAKADALFAETIPAIIEERAKFLGTPRETAADEVAVELSSYRISRARKLVATSATAAREYVIAHRDTIDDEAYDRFLSAYEDEALNEWAESAVGDLPASATAPAPEGAPAPPRQEKPLDLTQAHHVRSGLGGRVAPHTGGGRRGSSNHKGLDLDYPANTPVPASLSGTARLKRDPNGYGNYVVIDHGGGLETRYAHLASFRVRDGQRVAKGDIIGASGSTGNSSGPHLHYEARQDGRVIDPRTIGERTVHPRGTAPVRSAAGTDIGAIVDGIRAREDLSPKQKQALIGAYRGRFNERQQNRAFRESEAQRAADKALVDLGDKFTSTTQIPNFEQLSPGDQRAYQSQARQNREGGGRLTPDMAAYIQYMEIANPQRFITPAFRTELAAKGVPASVITSVAARGGQIAATIATAKPDPVSDGQLWTVAGPAFAAAGLHFESLEGSTPKEKVAERVADAQKKQQALAYLRDVARRWAQANPGKHPDEATMRGWVGYALLPTSKGEHAFQASDALVARNLTPAFRSMASEALSAAGVPVNDQTLAGYYREAVARRARPR